MVNISMLNTKMAAEAGIHFQEKMIFKNQTQTHWGLVTYLVLIIDFFLLFSFCEVSFNVSAFQLVAQLLLGVKMCDTSQDQGPMTSLLGTYSNTLTWLD